MAKTVVRARIDEAIKDEAAAVLAAMGLTVSDAFRLLLVRIAREKALPFEPLVPNAETIEAMKAARRGDLVTVGSVEQLFADLGRLGQLLDPYTDQPNGAIRNVLDEQFHGGLIDLLGDIGGHLEGLRPGDSTRNG